MMKRKVNTKKTSRKSLSSTFKHWDFKKPMPKYLTMTKNSGVALVEESDTNFRFAKFEISKIHSKEPKLLCPIRECKFKSKVTLNCFDEHCTTVHKWKPTACLIDGCQYVGYNSTILAQHKTMLHSKVFMKFLTCERLLVFLKDQAYKRLNMYTIVDRKRS